MSKKNKNDDFIIVEGDIYRKGERSGYSTDYYVRFVDGPTGYHHFYIETLVAFLNEHDFTAFEEKWEKEHPYQDEMGG